MITTTLRLGNDMIHRHITKRKVNPTSLTIPLLLTIQHMLVTPVIRQFLYIRTARNILTGNNRRQSAFEQSILIRRTLQTLSNQRSRQRTQIYTHPLTTQFLRRDTRRRTSTKRIQHYIALI